MNKKTENGINSPSFNDNRNYNYSGFEEESRKEYRTIVDLIRENSSVIDLGCGNGSLLSMLKKEKGAVCKGLEISPSGIEASQKKGLDVTIGSIDEPLPFPDNTFDYAVCNVTIQMVMYPEILLKEMKRIAKYQIITFPNFAFYRNRIDMFINGRMPKTMLFGYKWYSTGHIHQLSIKDFKELVDDVGGLHIKEMKLIPSGNSFKDYLTARFPDLFMLLPVFMLEKI